MAHTASRTSIGFEPIYNKTVTTIPNPVAYELTPNTAFAKGDMVVLTGGKVALATAASVAGILGVMAESIAAADNPAAGLTFGKVYDHPDNVYRCTFSGQLDSTVDSATTTVITDAGCTFAADDSMNGALVYVYEGTNAGCIRTISDSDATADSWTVTNPFPVAPDTTTKYIVLGRFSAANEAINVGMSGIVLVDENTIDASAARLAQAGLVGPLVCVGASKVADLMLDVMIRRSCHLFG